MKILFIRHILNYIHPSISYGMGVVVTILDQAGFEVKAIDNNSFYKYYSDNELIKIIKHYRPEVIGFNVTMINSQATYRLIERVKKVFSDKIIVGGGIHMKVCFKEALEYGFDVVVNKEGEKIVIPLFKHLEGKTKKDFRKNLELIPGVSFIREDGSTHFATNYPSVTDLDEVPFVDYRLFNIGDYYKTKREPGMLLLNGQRGCPFRCTFCSTKEQIADRRLASADYMFRHLEYNYKNFGVRYISITDNNFFISRKRAIEFCHKMIKSGLNKEVSMICNTKVETIPPDDEFISFIKEAGFIKIMFGLERLDPYSLKMINKQTPFEKIDQLFSILIKHNISIRVNALLGFPFETVELLEKERTAFFKMLNNNPSIIPEAAVLQPVPGTIYYDDYPKTKRWYLRPGFNKLLNTYFAKVFTLSAVDTIKMNFYDLPKETLTAIGKLYVDINRVEHERIVQNKGFFGSLPFKIDVLFGKMSRLVFKISPLLESFIFRRINTLRYYLGTFLFGEKMLEKEKD